ncbi:class I SAM-dependent methyltransferase [Roseibium sp. SCP14]|uniref:class I SAM-dependent methyltransferase n=1 Tax=Roseibium sp. SCP14 TaxID=3141375 RepID=UPI0033370C14
MAFDYDALYRKAPHALGKPTKAFCEFFETYPKKGARILDVGCGQGRDALFIARLGHLVTGVDLAPAGILDLLEEAKREGLSIKGFVTDIVDYDPVGLFDVIVIDRTLHMLDREPRREVLRKLTNQLSTDGYLLIADEPSNLPDFRNVLETAPGTWRICKASKGILFVQRQSEERPISRQTVDVDDET